MSAEGTVSTLRTVACYVDRVVASPMGDGLYCHCSQFLPGLAGLLLVPLPEGAERPLLPPVFPRSGFAPRGPLFAVAADNKSLYLGEAGRLWKMTLPSGDREPVAFHAQLKLDIREPTPPLRAALTAGRSVPLRSILSPRALAGTVAPWCSWLSAISGNNHWMALRPRGRRGRRSGCSKAPRSRTGRRSRRMGSSLHLCAASMGSRKSGCSTSKPGRRARWPPGGGNQAGAATGSGWSLGSTKRSLSAW